MSRDFNCTNVMGVFSDEFVPGNVGSSLMARFYNRNSYFALSESIFSPSISFVHLPENAEATLTSISADVSKPSSDPVSTPNWTSVSSLSPVGRLLRRITRPAPALVCRSNRGGTSQLSLTRYSPTFRHIRATTNQSNNHT